MFSPYWIASTQDADEGASWSFIDQDCAVHSKYLYNSNISKYKNFFPIKIIFWLSKNRVEYAIIFLALKSIF